MKEGDFESLAVVHGRLKDLAWCVKCVFDYSAAGGDTAEKGVRCCVGQYTVAF